MKGFMQWFKSSNKMKRWILLILVGIILSCYGLAKILVMQEITFQEVGKVIGVFVLGFISIITGLISGIVSGLGMGGGTILILILTLFGNIEQHIAQATNLIFFIPTSLAAIWINYKQKIIDIKLGLIIGGIGCIGAILGSIISNKLDTNILKKIFGVFLGFIAINEIYNIIKSNKKKQNNT